MKTSFIYYSELELKAGFEVSELPKAQRLVAGREVSMPKGMGLFSHVHQFQGSLTCWNCGCSADRWIVERNRNDKSKPVMNLYGLRNGQLVLMTRDHIIPVSLGGVDDIANLRVGCSICNQNRGNHMDLFDLSFMEQHPELVRVTVGPESSLDHYSTVDTVDKIVKGDSS